MFCLKFFVFLILSVIFVVVPCQSAIARLSDITHSKNAAKIADAYGGGSDITNNNNEMLSAGHIIDTNKPDTSRARVSALSYATNSDNIDATYGNDRSEDNSYSSNLGGTKMPESAYMKNSKKIDAAFVESQSGNIGTKVNADNPSKSQSLYTSIFNGGK